VAEAMYRYYDLRITTLLLKGFESIADAVEFGGRLLPQQGESATPHDVAAT
jgi:alkanesulfonate monooxygenase